MQREGAAGRGFWYGRSTHCRVTYHALVTEPPYPLLPPPQVIDMVTSACTMWLKEYRVDGLRFDSANDLPGHAIQVGGGGQATGGLV